MNSLNENFLARRTEDDWLQRGNSPSVENLEALTLNPTGIKNFAEMLTAVGQADREAQELGALALQWLLRAWPERDTISKFMFLFIPLEVILEGFGGKEQEGWAEYAVALRQLIDTQAGEQRDELREFVNRLMERQRPSLQARFEELASRARLAGWQGDVQAFRQFNRIRNALLHRGDRGVRMLVSVGQEEVRQLEDLVERYVCYVLFRDDRVYQSRWRMKKSVSPEDRQ